MRKPRAMRLSIILLATLIAILAIAYLAIPPILQPMLTKKLQTMVAEHLHAELAIGDLDYRIPYTLHIKTARLLVRDHDDVPALLSIDQLDLTLAELPRHGKPLVIRSMYARHPKVSMVRAPSGELIGKDIVVKEPPKPEQPKHKPSDYFQLRHFKIDDGEINFEDRTKPAEQGMAWTGISSDLNITPNDKALYDYHFVVNNEQLVTLDAAGKMDIDQLILRIDKLSMHAAVAPIQSKSPLPTAIQRLIEKFKIKGEMSLDATANVPLRDLANAKGSGRLQLKGANAQLKELAIEELALDLNADRNDSQPPRIDLATEGHVAGAAFQIDKTAIEFAGGAIIFRDVHARYGQDDIKLIFARIVRGSPARLESLVSEVNFHAPSPLYPPPLRGLVSRLNPTGAFRVLGDTTLDKPLTKTDLTVNTDDAALRVVPHNLPFNHVRGEVHIDEKQIELRDATGKLMDGDVSLKGTIETPRPHKYALESTVKNVNIEPLASALSLAVKEQGKLRGLLSGQGTIKGSGSIGDKSALDLLSADGELECHQGDLWQGNVLSGIVDNVKVSKEKLETGEAAAVFSIRDRTVQLKSAAINSPLLGLQGSGTITFDRKLDLDVVAAPLGDWKMNLKKLKIPIVSDVTGEIAGAVQKLLSAATSELLYQFHVTGDTHQPKVTAIPAPILTETAAALFGKMTKEQQKEHALLESIREKKERAKGQ